MADIRDQLRVVEAWGGKVLRASDSAVALAGWILDNNAGDVEMAIALGSEAQAKSFKESTQRTQKISNDMVKVMNGVVDHFELDSIADLQVGPFIVAQEQAKVTSALESGESIGNLTALLIDQYENLPPEQQPISSTSKSTREAFGFDPGGQQAPTGGDAGGGGFDDQTFAALESAIAQQGRTRGQGTPSADGQSVSYADGSMDIITTDGQLIQVLGVNGEPLRGAEGQLPTIEDLMESGLSEPEAVAALRRITLRSQGLTAGAIDDILGDSGGTGGFSAAAANAARQQGFFEGTEFPESVRQFDLTAAERERSSRATEGISGFNAQTSLGLGLGDLVLSEAQIRNQILNNPDDALARIFAQSNELSPFGRFTAADQLNLEGRALQTALQRIPGGEQAVFSGSGFNEPAPGAAPLPATRGGFAPPELRAPTAAPAPSGGGGAVVAPSGGGFVAPALTGGPTGLAPIIGRDAASELALPPRRTARSLSPSRITGLEEEEIQFVRPEPTFTSQLAGFAEEEFFAGGGFTTAPVLRVGEDPKGKRSGFEETVVNPTNAPLFIDPSKKAKRLGAPGFATGTFDPFATLSGGEFNETSQQELIDLSEQATSGRIGTARAGGQPGVQSFGFLPGGALPTLQQTGALTGDERSVLDQFLRLGTAEEPGATLEDIEFAQRQRSLNRRQRPRARQRGGFSR